MALLRRGKKHPKNRPGVRQGSVMLSQMMSCPNRIMSAEHWIDVKRGGHCRCVAELSTMSELAPGLPEGSSGTDGSCCSKSGAST